MSYIQHRQLYQQLAACQQTNLAFTSERWPMSRCVELAKQVMLEGERWDVFVLAYYRNNTVDEIRAQYEAIEKHFADQKGMTAIQQTIAAFQ